MKSANLIALTTVGLLGPNLNCCVMLHFVDVILKDVLSEGGNFNWPRPSCCPRCQHYKVWGHGFVERFFDSFSTSLLIKRFRCNHCGCVICCRPTTHFDRIQSSRKAIKSSITHRLMGGCWPTGTPGNRQRHWLINLKRKVLARFGIVNIRNHLTAYDDLVSQGHIPVSYSV